MTQPRIGFLAVAALFVLLGCSAAGAPSPSTPTLDGHTYLSTDVDGADLVPETRVRLAFQDGNLNASAGCNIMGGVYTIDGDRITTTQLSMTEMGCDEPRAQQDEWLARFLSSAVQFTLDADTLMLTDGTVTIELLDEEVATPDQPLEGTHWMLDGMISGDTVSSVPAGVTASIRIVDGRADVGAGCNQGGGSAEVTPDTITFGPLMLTKMACEAGASAVESAVVTVLSGPVPYTIDGDRLTLITEGAGLSFRAAP
jgi:heat shock protein HslJ